MSLSNAPRKEFPASVKRAALQRANGRCEDCGGPPPFHYDHDNPDYFSKDNSLENCVVRCHECHKRKTKTDAKNIAKTKRIIKKRLGLTRAKKQIKSRGFTGWRKFNGQRVWRD